MIDFKKLTLALLLLVIPSMSTAQGVLRQQGYVRTVGRPDAPKGRPLAGVLIGVQGQSNNVRSRQDGCFEIPFNHAFAGTSAFKLSKVVLGGYSLYETSIMGRQLPVSPNFPLEIVMISAKDVEAMKQKFMAQAQQRYQAELNKLKAEKARLGERYQAELDRVNEKYKNCDAYVADLVERFSHIDYATLDYQTSCIYAAIENGNLDEADRLLNQTNSEELLKARESITRHIEQEQASVRNIDRKLSDYYEGKFEVHAARFDKDSAAWYIQRLVALDTTNVKNLVKAADFYHSACHKYPEALSYFKRALRQLTVSNQENSLDAALCNRKLCELYQNMEHYEDALQSVQNAMRIFRNGDGEETENMARCYMNLSDISGKLGDTVNVVNYMQKSIDIRTRLFGPHYIQLANNYNNLALFYAQRGQYAMAQDCYEKGIALVDTTDRNAPDILGSLYSNWGGMNYRQGKYEESLRLLWKAEYYQCKNRGDGWLFYCMTLHAIGNNYVAMGKRKEGESFWQRAMNLQIESFGEYGIPLIPYYEEKANILRSEGNYELALEYYRKVGAIEARNDMSNDKKRAWLNERMAPCYYNTGRYEQSFAAYTATCEYMQEEGILTPQYDYDYTIMRGLCLFKMGRIHEAYDTLLAAEEIRKKNKLEPGQEIVGLYRCYCALIKSEGEKWRKPFKKFMADKIFQVVIPKSRLDIPGEDTEFLLVKYGLWYWEDGSEFDIFECTEGYDGDSRQLYIYLPEAKHTVYLDFNLDADCTINMIVAPLTKLQRKVLSDRLWESREKLVR